MEHGPLTTRALRRPAIRQLPLPFAPPPPTPAPSFFAAASNQAALAWLQTPQSWPEGRLVLWGEAGIGKSHLLRIWGLANAAAGLTGSALCWPMPLATGVTVDDADLAPEEPLLHLLNAAALAGHPVLLAARNPAAVWPTRLPDLASRLRAVPAVRIEPPEDGLLRRILLRICADRQLSVPEPVQEFLLAHLPRTPAALQEAAARLDRAALASGGRVTRTLAAAVVDEIAAMWHAATS